MQLNIGFGLIKLLMSLTRRQGRSIEDPTREVTKMFVKHCPDQSLSAILKFKSADR